MRCHWLKSYQQSLKKEEDQQLQKSHIENLMLVA